MKDILDMCKSYISAPPRRPILLQVPVHKIIPRPKGAAVCHTLLLQKER